MKQTHIGHWTGNTAVGDMEARVMSEHTAGPMEQWALNHGCADDSWHPTLAGIIPFAREQDAIRAELERAVRHAAYRSHELSDACDACAEVRAAIARSSALDRLRALHAGAGME